MADPFTGGMAAVSAGSSLLGGLFSAKGEKEKANASAEQFAYKAALARKNAAINRENSNRALSAGEYNAMREGMSTSFNISKQKVAQAGSGFDVNEGTPADVRDSTHRIGLMDQATIRKEAGYKAQGYRQAAAQEESDAVMLDKAAANAKKAGEVSVFSTLLGTAGSVADKWFKSSSSFSSGSSGITTYGSNFEPVGFYPT